MSVGGAGLLSRRRTQLLLVLISLIAMELALQVASRASLAVERLLASPWDVAAVVIPDPSLVLRGNRLNLQHDAAGYRNPWRPTTADIVVLGDSHAYGPSDRNLAWPRLLARETGRSVYNMSLPGYGPGQSLLQLDDALSLHPGLVIVAPYFGNDFFDTYELYLRHPTLAEAGSTALQAAAAALERQRPLERDVGFLFEMGQAAPPVQVSALRRLISERVRLYGLLRALWYRIVTIRVVPTPLLPREFRSAASALTPAQRQFASPLDGPEWRTILTPPYRGRVLDDRDPRIRLGFETARHAVRLIGERCRAAHVDLLVVFMPTKENVFWPRVTDPDRHPGLRRLVADEERLKQEWISDLNAAGIKSLDVLPALRAAPAQPYYENVDGHPNETGQRIVAGAVAAADQVIE